MSKMCEQDACMSDTPKDEYALMSDTSTDQLAQWAEQDDSSDDEDAAPMPRGVVQLPSEIFGTPKIVDVTFGAIQNSPMYSKDMTGSKELGQGTFGVVKVVMVDCVQRAVSAKYRAVKIVNVNHTDNFGLKRECLNKELVIHSEATEAQKDLSALKPPVLTPPNHHLVVMLHDIFVDNHEISVVMERCGKSISEFMAS